jgi:hypothetical protein
MNATYQLPPQAMPQAWLDVIRKSAKATEGDRYHPVVEKDIELPAMACERCGGRLVPAGPLRVSERGNYICHHECLGCNQRYVVGSVEIAPGVKVWMSRSKRAIVLSAATTRFVTTNRKTPTRSNCRQSMNDFAIAAARSS